jgi:hypothetical protein
MKRLLLVIPALVALFVAGMALAQPPLPDWTLSQNFPNPFCNESSNTRIQYALAQQSETLLEVWSPDTVSVLRVLVNGAQSAGYYEFVWDGRDGEGVLLPNGEYPYSLTATQPGGGPVLFEGMLVASIICVPIGHSTDTWSKIKALFGE